MKSPLPIRITRRAAAQIDEAAGWWAVNRPAAPGAIIQELQEAYVLIATQPRIGAAARSARLRGVRRIHLSRVHYDLYYRETSEMIEVLAFWHSRRGAPPPV